MEQYCFCTVVTASHLRYALALARSLKRHHPESNLHVLLLDPATLPKQVESADARIVPLEALSIPDLERLRIVHDAFSLSNNLKPLWIERLLRDVAEKVIYLDSDILVVGRFDALLRLLDRSYFVLSPHVLRPERVRDSSVSLEQLVDLGVYNGGMWGVSRGPDAFALLRWLSDTLLETDMPFADQRILPLAAQLFADGFEQIRDPGYNVAYWNVHERRVEAREGRYLVDTHPATFFHLSGFDDRSPTLFSKHRPVSREQLPSRDDIIAEYLSLIPKEHVLNVTAYGHSHWGPHRLTPARRRYFAQHHTFKGYRRARIRRVLAAIRRAMPRLWSGE